MIPLSSQTLAHSISEKAPYLVVSFNGVFNGATARQIESCQSEIQRSIAERGTRFVVLNFQDVTKIDTSGYAP
ncbi:MAG: hypothetical protein HY075_08620, partial [Deltaproteobacteria bacterium]|nr:hypothetical protein [Deltaproteobacteria bacterium]